MLRPQDILVIAWLGLNGVRPWRYVDLAHALLLSPSEAHAACQRLLAAGLIHPAAFARNSSGGHKGSGLNVEAAIELLAYGVRYVFYPERGPVTRGIPTGFAAAPLKASIQSGTEIPVWPHEAGKVRGYALKPLYRSVPAIALADAKMYEVLALVDAIRDGRARERALAIKRIGGYFE